MPDPTPFRPGVVVGTAGHIDHGKTSLIRALTGIDTDRLPDERRRGISIDLGFAHLELEPGLTVSFIDVPGHERFVRNMLAGVAGTQAVMLIVAATEGVMPQTREHFEICRLLHLQQGFVVLTKVDVASRDQIEAACQGIHALCAGSFLEAAPVIHTSSQTGQGIADIKAQLRKLHHLAPTSGVVPRLWVDRSFVKKGFGTVVTGTLGSGTLRAGDAIHIFPGRRPGRVRSMQTHSSLVDAAHAGQRTALNLSGVDSSEVARGNALTLPSEVRDSAVLDVAVEWLDRTSLPTGRAGFLFHIGSAELPAEVKVLDPQSGSRSLARVWTPEPVLAFPGDRFILRQPSPTATVAGGTIIDINPPLRLNRTRTVQRLNALLAADESSRLELLIEEAPAGRTFAELQRVTGLTTERIAELVRANPHLLLCEPQQIVVTKAWLGERRNRLANWLTAFHKQNPSLAGAPLAQARLGLRPDLAAVVFDKNPTVKITADTVCLATHKPLFSDQETVALARIEAIFRDAGFHPPTVAEALGGTPGGVAQPRGLLERLLRAKRLVRIADDLVFHADVVSHIRTSLAAHRGRRFSVPEFKEWTQMSRKYAIPMLEYLDRERITRRDGEQRIIL